jgi:peptide/nickel transport system permease protein
MSAVSDLALQAAPATKARGYWATVGRRIVRDKVSMACALILILIFASALLAIAISGALGAGIVNSIVSLTIVFVPQITRVAESVTTGVRNMDFVEAARASGAGPFTIMRVHILGNVLGSIFVYATSLISVSMILAAGLSFLGLGTKPPEPEWGLMLNTLRTAIYVNPWVAALPGAMFFAVSICFNLLSDGLRSAMDIRN